MNENFDEDQAILECFSILKYKHLQYFKSIEFSLEAVPQFALGIVYIVNNYLYLKEHDDHRGIGVPMTVISCVFSFGSIVIGIFTQYKRFVENDEKIMKEFVRNDDNSGDDENNI